MSPATRCLGLLLALGACEAVQETALTAEEGELLVLISMVSTDESPPTAKDSFRARAGPDAVESEPIPFEEWTEEEQAVFPKTTNGDLDPTWILLHVRDANSSCVDVFTPWGTMVTYCPKPKPQ
jgi:hypothetical protein